MFWGFKSSSAKQNKSRGHQVAWGWKYIHISCSTRFPSCLRSLNSGWGYCSLAGFTLSHMLKHTEQVGFTTSSGPLCSHPQSRAEATHISISYTDKLAFLLPGRFPHRRMKCESFGGFADARHTAFQVPTETRGARVRSSNRQLRHLIVQIKNEWWCRLQRRKKRGIVKVRGEKGVQYVVWAEGQYFIQIDSFFFCCFYIITNAVKS